MRLDLVRGHAAMALTITAIVLGACSEAQAACYGDNQKLAPDAISAFMANPAQVLQQNAGGGSGMISQLRDLVASDPATLPVVIGMLQNANSAQSSAVGTALGQAATICLRPDPEFANQIQSLLAQTGIDTAIQAYAAVTGNQPIGAGGGGGGGSAGAIGGSLAGAGNTTTGGSGAFFSFTNNATNNIPTNFFTGGTTGAGGTSTSTTTISSSVSP